MEYNIENKIQSNYIVVDIETTGFNKESNSIIEIGAIRYSKEGKKINEFSSFLKLEKRDWSGTRYSKKINNISDEMLVDAPEIAPVLEEFLKFIGRDVLIAHNGKDFDFPFLEVKIKKHLNKDINLVGGSIDTLFLSRVYLNLYNNKLKTVCSYFRIVNQQEHRALGDCEATNQCFLKILSIPKAVVVFPRVPKRS